MFAIELTLSVRSFQVPLTPRTFACPPSFPSVPTSRATRVTSLAKEASRSTMVLTTFALRRNSPRSGPFSLSREIRGVRSPFATAPMTRETSAVGCAMFSIRSLTASIPSRHSPCAWICRRREILPSTPTSLLARSISSTICRFEAMISLSVSTIFPPTPSILSGIRIEKSPPLTASRTWRIRRRSIPSHSSFPSASAATDTSRSGVLPGTTGRSEAEVTVRSVLFFFVEELFRVVLFALFLVVLFFDVFFAAMVIYLI